MCIRDRKKVVLDYKAGVIKPKGLNSDELSEPQLPLYAVSGKQIPELGGVPDGVGLLQVRAEEHKDHIRSCWTGSLIGGGRQNPVSDPASWDSEVKAWDKAMENRAQLFLSGCIEHDYSAASSKFEYLPHIPLLSMTRE